MCADVHECQSGLLWIWGHLLEVSSSVANVRSKMSTLVVELGW